MNRDPNYGRLLVNRYQLAELIGEGAMGRVYRAKDTVLGGVTVAIKFLSHALLNKNMRDRFEREATISALLGERSNHVVRVKDYGIDENRISFYVMEYLSGESLNEIIANQPLPLKRFLNVARHICLGLESAHQGISFNGSLCTIIHRDIKPSNIILLQDPTVGEIAKILDFGIAKLILENSSQTQSFMGTLAYCSPEQMEGKELDHRSDIYSLGVMMYEMLTSNMPIIPQNSSFGGWYQAHHDFKPTPFSDTLTISAPLKSLVLSCLEKSKDNRPQSVRDILTILEDLKTKSETFTKNQHNQDESTPVPEIPAKAALLPVKIEAKKPQEDKISHRNDVVVPSVTEICLQASWPKDKPLKKIVFARFMDSPMGELPVLSVMLDYEDILHRMSSIRYNQFLFLNHPHPMLLWITLLYSQEYGPRWLPCYIDLKSEKGQKISHSLATVGSYRILFFTLNQPQRCQHVMKSTVNPQNCRMLTQWADTGKLNNYAGTPQAANEFLRRELTKLKPKILFKLETTSANYSSDISG